MPRRRFLLETAAPGGATIEPAPLSWHRAEAAHVWPRSALRFGCGPRVLIVDDEPTAEAEIAVPLAQDGLTISRARTGEAALSMLAHEQWDLVLLNTSLPGISGVETCRRLRGRSEVPVVFLSTQGALPERLLAFDAGADDYIVRPVDATEVVCRLRAVLRRARRNAHGGVLTGPGELTLDVRAHAVRVGGAPVQTTPREFDVLRLLLERQGEVLTSDVISIQIWGYETFGSHNFVEAQLSRLRAKLRAAGAPGTITTVRGVGYVIR
jgi:DNA-binding response OmpR family regulator